MKLHVKGYTKKHPEVPAKLARHLCRAWAPEEVHRLYQVAGRDFR